MTSAAFILASAVRALVRHERPKRCRIFSRVVLRFTITLVILTAFICSGGKTHLRLQNSEASSAMKSPALPSTDKIEELEPVKLDFAKSIDRDSGPRSLLLNAPATSLPFSGSPYTGSAISLPGRIEAENFDNGGEGVAYHDTTAANDGGYYRSEGVDVCTCGSPYGLSVGWTQPGEWMEYTVTVASYGTYKFQTRTANNSQRHRSSHRGRWCECHGANEFA